MSAFIVSAVRSIRGPLARQRVDARGGSRASAPPRLSQSRLERAASGRSRSQRATVKCRTLRHLNRAARGDVVAI